MQSTAQLVWTILVVKLAVFDIFFISPKSVQNLKRKERIRIFCVGSSISVLLMLFRELIHVFSDTLTK
jgi:hypothetical protein